jgi:DNA-binding XRE family transcriptional regulator
MTACNGCMKASFSELTPKQKAEEKKAFTKKIAKVIHEIRLEKGLSQEELANKAGFYRTYIGHIETTTYSPSLYTVWRLAQALDVELSDLLRDI